jgi:hypothetical protein
MVDAQRIFYFSYVANLLRDDPGTKVVEAREKVVRYTAAMERLLGDNAGLRETNPAMFSYLARLAKRPSPYPDELQSAAREADREERPQRRGRRSSSTSPLFHAVYDAGFHIDGSDADFTMLDIRPGEPRDLHVLSGGNVARPGARAPRGFLSVLSKGDPKFLYGSGRLELVERIFSDAAPLSACVIVNRVWAWHFGKPLVGTAKRLRLAGRAAVAPRAARRPGRSFHRKRLLAQMAAPRNHALRSVLPIQPAEGRSPASTQPISSCGA